MAGTIEAYVNDRFLPLSEARISVEDRGMQFGDGIYEVLLIHGGYPIFLAEHMERLERSARGIRLSLPMSRAGIGEMIRALVARSNRATGIVYLQVTRGVQPRSHRVAEGTVPTLVAYTRDLPAHLPVESCVTLPDDRWLHCDLKTTCLLPNVLAKEAAAQAGADEAIFHRDGVVTEGASTNVFIVDDHGQIHTHPTGPWILAGITRQVVVRIAQERGFALSETPFDLDQLSAASEVFLTSTTAHVRPVNRIDGRLVGSGRPGPVTQRLMEAYAEVIDSEASVMSR